jgi:phosphoglycolate phosphatase-like HAD superfamily hydrolase
MSKPEAYVELNGGDLGVPSYVRRDSLRLLEAVDAVVFDCDGVLIDVRGSYNRAISKAVTYILKNLTGCSFPEDLISDEVIFSFRKSGGFNNDWDSTYGLLMYLLCNIPSNLRNSLKKALKSTRGCIDLCERLTLIGGTMQENRQETLSADLLDGLTEGLLKFSENLDETGIWSVDKNLTKRIIDKESRAFYGELKRFLGYPGEVGGSLIATAFEEIFCGPALFRETFKAEPKFYTEEPGFIEKEAVIIRPETLNSLASMLGKPKFGVSSGSGVKQAEHVLGNILDSFSPEALVFREVIESAKREAVEKSNLTVSLWKPNPFSLLRVAEALEPFTCILYVGDSMEDAIMVERIEEKGQRFLFAGVYYYSTQREATLNAFLKADCDMIIPSVNELPLILERIRRKDS